ncbi:DPP IV N-terminal domain-containing protein [Porticoccaceae bacterium]|nr:DPP IV N-terminal domain-containing protein [Porticoccaceae bacterium]
MNASQEIADTHRAEVTACYRRAEALTAGSLVQNDMLAPHWIPGSDYCWYERATKTCDDGDVNIGKEYRLVNAAAASNESAFDHAVFAKALAMASGKEEGDVNKNNLPITKVDINFAISRKPSTLMINFIAFDQPWVFSRETQQCESAEAAPTQRDEPLSPDGQQQVFVRDFNLWLRNLSTGEERALTFGGEEFNAYGAEHGVWGVVWPDPVPGVWSSDSTRFLTVRRDRRLVKTTPLVNNIPADGSTRPTVEHIKVAYPGDEHVETFKLLSIDITTGKFCVADYGPMNTGYGHQWGLFASNVTWWANDNQRAYCIELERGDRVLRLLEFNTNTGGVRALFEETSQTHINLFPEFTSTPLHRPMLASNELIWWSQRSGWGHLYLYDLTTGELKQTITSGEWLVRDVLFVDEVRREILIQTAGRVMGRNPYYRDVCRVNIDTGELTTILSADEDISVHYRENFDENINAREGQSYVYPPNCVSPEGNYMVITRSRVDQAPVSQLLGREGQQIIELEVTDTSGLPSGWHWPKPVQVTAADGKTQLCGVLFYPSDFSADNSYPVINFINGDPSLSVVPSGSFNSSRNHYGNFHYFHGAALAQLGFIVLILDSRGTPLRSKVFQDESYGWAPSAANTADHTGAIKQLAERYPYMDLNRVGSYSTGYHGGLINYLECQDLYKVHVQGAAMFDSRLMGCSVIGDVWEGIEGPVEDKRYPEELAENLQGKLLVVHAISDPARSPCYPPAVAIRFFDALQRANKDFDMIMLPRSNAFYGPYITRRIWDYFVEHLAQELPPKDIKLSASMVF